MTTSLTISWANENRDVDQSPMFIGPDYVFNSYRFESYGLVLISKRTKYIHPWHTITRVEASVV
jgi:hypothetical protein